MAQGTIKKWFTSYLGLDLRSSKMTRDDRYSTLYENAETDRTTDVVTRKGYKARADDLAYAGLAKFGRLNLDTGQVTNEGIGISNTIKRLITTTFTVDYTGSNSSVAAQVVYEPTTADIRFRLIEGSSTVLDFDCGAALNESSPATLAQLKTAIDALSDYSATIGGNSSLPAALLPYDELQIFSSSTDATFEMMEWEDINTTVAAPLAGNATNRGAADFENTAWVNLRGNLYLTNGYDDPLKYDGQTLYRMGLPKPSAAPSTALAGGSLTDTNIRYSNTYLQIDANFNVTEGQESDQSAAISPSSQDVTVTVQNIQAGTGFNTNCAIVDGGQTTVTTIDVDDGAAGAHTLQVGDTAYFFDSVTGDYVTREVTARTASTITIAGAAVTVADNAVISNNLRIAIYRTTAGGILRFLVAEIPNNSFAATQDFVDDGSTLGAVFNEPVVTPSLPPKARYITAFQNFIVLTGSPSTPNTVYVADITNSKEGFDAFNRSFDVLSGEGDVVSGCGANDQFLFIGKGDSTFTVSGDLATFRIRVDQNRGDRGLASHHSIKAVEGYLFYLSGDNVYRITSGQIAEPIGQAIQPVFFSDVENSGANFNLKRAVAINDVNDQKYLLFLPTESVDGGELSADSSSRVFVFDYYRGSWGRWNGINASSGFIRLDEDLYWAERRLSPVNNAVESYLFKRSNNDNSHDYVDHVTPIEFVWGSDWDDSGDPKIFKKLLYVTVESLQPSETETFNLDIEVEYNYLAGLVVNKKSIETGFGGEGWGLSAWGTFAWGDPTVFSDNNESRMKMRYQKHFSYRVIFRANTPLEKVQMTGWTSVLKFPYRMKVKEG